MELVYKERGGVTIGRSYWFNSDCTWPFGSIEVYYDKIVLKILWFKTEVKSYEVTSIDRKGLFRNYIKINHKNKFISPYLAFSSFHPKRLTQKLTEAGYKFKEKN